MGGGEPVADRLVEQDAPRRRIHPPSRPGNARGDPRRAHQGPQVHEGEPVIRLFEVQGDRSSRGATAACDFKIEGQE